MLVTLKINQFPPYVANALEKRNAVVKEFSTSVEASTYVELITQIKEQAIILRERWTGYMDEGHNWPFGKPYYQVNSKDGKLDEGQSYWYYHLTYPKVDSGERMGQGGNLASVSSWNYVIACFLDKHYERLSKYKRSVTADSDNYDLYYFRSSKNRWDNYDGLNSYKCSLETLVDSTYPISAVEEVEEELITLVGERKLYFSPSPSFPRRLWAGVLSHKGR